MNRTPPLVGAILAAGLSASAFAQPAAAPAITGLREIPFTQVQIKDSFWAPRREVNRTVSLAHSLDMLEKVGNISDLELAAQGRHEGFKGPVYIDSDLYKCLESISYSLATDPDPALEARLDAIIAKMAAAQQPDGYLNTWYQVNAPGQRFTNLRDHHELYCAGHLFEAASAHYLATGKKTLLDIATRYADLLCATFGDGPERRPGYCGHPEIELALVKLSKVTGRQKYFDLAAHFVNARGSKFFAAEHNNPPDAYNGEYWQDQCPIREHEHVAGHAVRFGYLMSACVDVGVGMGDEGLLKMTRRVWKNTAERNTFITGGIGPSASNEGFTRDYDLPNRTAYQETCASVALAMWNHRMNLAYADARYADCVETALYNGILSGVSQDGRKFFYVNPLTSDGGHHRSDWFGCACCPPNVTRTLAALGNYAYAVDEHGVWVNLYIQGSVHTKVGAGEVTLDVTTEYPWDGRVTIAVQPSTSGPQALHLRIPGWSRGASAQVNGAPIAKPVIEKGYLVIERDWRQGDTVELTLPMPVRRVESNPNVVEDRGRLAIARGPLVYCVEGMDIDAPFWSFGVPADASLTAARSPDLLGGVVTITGEAIAREDRDWAGTLYREAAPVRKVMFTAVPYYAWDNRKPAPMQVWLPTSPPPSTVMGLEGTAKVSVSFRNDNSQVEGIHDGVEPSSSGEQSAALCHWWPHKGATEWACYTWDKPRTFGAAGVYWFDDTGRGECRLPASWRLLYKDGPEWKPVEALGGFTVTKDRWCEVKFKPVTTADLRLEVQMQKGWAAGVHEWRVTPLPEE